MAVRLRLFRAHRKLREKLNEKYRPARRHVKAGREQLSKNWTVRNRPAPTYQTVGFACGGD
jgi:hypothetical protein